MANIYRTMAADYSELARQYCVTVQYLRRAVCNKDFGRRTRRRAIKLLRHEMQRVIATTEQVELHLEQALEKDLS